MSAEAEVSFEIAERVREKYSRLGNVSKVAREMGLTTTQVSDIWNGYLGRMKFGGVSK